MRKIPPPASLRDKWRSRREFAEVWGVSEANVNAHARAGRIASRALRLVGGSRSSAFHEYRWRADDLYALECWRSITSLSEWLELPRTSLERRLFERESVISLQWEHYEIRESDVPGRRWEVRITPGYSADPLTREQVKELLSR